MKYLVIIFALFVGNVFSQSSYAVQKCIKYDEYQEYLKCIEIYDIDESEAPDLKAFNYEGTVINTGFYYQNRNDEVDVIKVAKKNKSLLRKTDVKRTYEIQIYSRYLDGPKEWPRGGYKNINSFETLNEFAIFLANEEQKDFTRMLLSNEGSDYCGEVFYKGTDFTNWDYLPTVKPIIYISTKLCISDIEEKLGKKISENLIFKATQSNRKFKRTFEYIPTYKDENRKKYNLKFRKFEEDIATFEYTDTKSQERTLYVDLSITNDIYLDDVRVHILDINDSKIEYKLLPYKESERLLAVSEMKRLKQINEKEAAELLIAQEQAERDAYFKELVSRCIKFGFTGEDNIAACTQREANNDKQLALQQEQINLQTIAIEQNNLRIAKLEDANERYQEELLDKISRLQVSATTNRSTVNKADILTSVFSGITNAYFDGKQQAREQKRLRNIIRQEVRSARPINYYQNRNN